MLGSRSACRRSIMVCSRYRAPTSGGWPEMPPLILSIAARSAIGCAASGARSTSRRTGPQTIRCHARLFRGGSKPVLAAFTAPPRRRQQGQGSRTATGGAELNPCDPEEGPSDRLRGCTANRHTFLSRPALDAGIFDPYTATDLARRVPKALQLYPPQQRHQTDRLRRIVA